MIIAIDGPAGTGKSTVASIIAKRLGITYLNSGSFYRAITLALLEAKVDISNEEKVLSFAKTLRLEYENSHLILNGADVEARLHEDEVSASAAKVSAIVPIRHLVNERLLEITKTLSVVCEGRDMTTVVFPNAEYKFYLDASVEEQAKRRFNQGVSKMSLEEIKKAIIARDEIDKNKKEGSLKIAKDAQYIDTTRLTINEVCAKIISKINQKGE